MSGPQGINGPIIKGVGFSTSGGTGSLSDLAASLDRFEALGATHAELSLSQEDVIVGGRVVPKRRDELARICAARRLAYTVHGPLCGNFMDEAHLDQHKAVVTSMLELCDAVGADVLVQHTGRPQGSPGDFDPAHLLEVERRTLLELAPTAERYGVRVAVENLFMEDGFAWTADPEELARHLAAIDHPNICGTLDFSHAWIMTTGKGMDYAQALKAFAPMVNHIHVHDSFGKTPTLKTFTQSERFAYGFGDLHLPLGWGAIPFEEILPQLSFRPGTVMIVELPKRWWSEIEDTFAKAVRYAEILNAKAA